MATRSGGSIEYCLLLLLLPTLLLAQDDCSHNCKTEANRYYYVRPEGSVETLCPAQPCLTPSQLREHFSECERNNSCQTANTSLVLLPGTYTSASNNESIVPPQLFLSLTGYSEHCNTNSLTTPSIDCNGTSVSLMFQHIKCLRMRNCVVFTGHNINVEVDHVTFHDSLIRLASITAADHSKLDYNYTLGSQSYCLLQTQLADVNVLVPSNSVLALRNVSFSTVYHTACAREYGIQLATIRATDSALDIADCLFTQNAITHISLLHSTLVTSGMVLFENANTAIIVISSFIDLAGDVNFFNNNNSAMLALDTHSTILLAGTVEFTNNTADSGGAVSMLGGSLTIANNAQVVFQDNHAKTFGGAIASNHNVTVAGSVQFINNSADQGGALVSDGNVTIAENAQVVFQGNRAKANGGAIFSSKHVTTAGSVQFIHNSASQGGAINADVVNVILVDNAEVVFQDNHAKTFGGAIASNHNVTVAGSVRFINNSADQGGALVSDGNVTIAENAQVVFQGNRAKANGGAIFSSKHVTIAGSVQFINNSANNGSGGAIIADVVNVTLVDNTEVIFQGNHAKIFGGSIGSELVSIAGSVQFINNIANQGGAIGSGVNVTIADNAQVVFQGNHAKTFGGAIFTLQHVTIAGSVQFINNSANQGGAIDADDVTIANNAQVVFQGNHANTFGGAIDSGQHVTVAGSVQFINNSANQGGSIDSDVIVTIADNAQVIFQGNRAKASGGAISSIQHVTIAGSVQFINNSANLGSGGAIASDVNVTIADNAQVVFQGNHAKTLGGAIFSLQHVTISGSVQFINNSGNQGGSIDSDAIVTIADNAQVVFQGNRAKASGGAISSLQHVTIAGSVQFINNSANQGGAIDADDVTIANNAQVVFQGNHANTFGGAIDSGQHVTVAGSVQFINNSANQGGSIDSNVNVSIANNAQVVFQGNHAKASGGAIFSLQHVTISGSVQFINNSANQGGAIDSDVNVTIIISNNAQVVFQGNRAKVSGGAIFSLQHVSVTGSAQFINNNADQGGAIASDVNVTVANNVQVVFQGNHANTLGGAISSGQHVSVAGSVQFVNNSANNGSGGAIVCYGNVTIANNSQVDFQSNRAKTFGGAIFLLQHVTIAGSVKFINNSANHGGAINGVLDVTFADNAQVVFQGNRAKAFGGAIASSQHATIAGSVLFVNNIANQGGAINAGVLDVTFADNAQVVFQDNHAKIFGGAIATNQHVAMAGSVQFINNSASQGGAIGSNGTVTIADTAQVFLQGNHAKVNGGAIVSYHHVTVAGLLQFINNSANEGGAIYSSVSVTVDKYSQVIFQGNHAKAYGGAISSSQLVTVAGKVQFINNSARQGGAILCTHTVTVDNNAQVLFQGNHADSLGGAIVILSDIVLAGSVQFINNTAQLGGAISLIEGHMTVANNTEVVFQGNHAYHVGGAIHSSRAILVNFKQKHCSMLFGNNTKMDLLYNTAERGGSAMYSIFMSDVVCSESKDSEYEYLFDIITIIPDSFSAVSSDPLRVCICPDQSTPDCLAILPDQNIPHLHYTVYPGQIFTIPAAVVGFNFALTSGSVYAQFLSSDASLGSDTQYVQGVNQTGCSPLQYSVLSDITHETLVLTTDGRHVGDIDISKEDIRMQNDDNISLMNYSPIDVPFSNPNKYYVNNTFMTSLTDGIFRLAGNVEESLQNAPIFVSVRLLDCPPGFTLTGKHRCDCNERILTNLLTCNINNQTVRRHGNIWVNATFSGNTSSGVIVHKHCPFEYCKPEQLDVNLTHPETQCAFDHCGTLCGACKPNFSLALGGSQCLPNCSNKYLLLLIVFILAGFALVFFIKILNLTVSQGTINGLIFYANIVGANRSIFFPAQHNKFLSFLSVFISWLNLDLGIETCFIKGLDGYWKTWLQFVFPFYVWLIAAAIIIVSRYSTRATKIFGDKSVSVLATLFLLSYGKLLQSIITIFSFTTLDYPENTTATVWSFDGNLRYLGLKHIPLFLFALITLLLLWLPYTAVLLSARWLRTQTHRKGLRWLKPFLDAYYGPFKDKHHYWVGILLVVRGVLFVFFSSFFAVENNVNLLLTIVGSISLAALPGASVYKNVCLSTLENSFFLNLGVLAAGTFYIRLVGGNQETLVTTSVGIAFLEFCVIVILHSYQFVIIPIRKWHANVRANDGFIDNAVQLQLLLNSDSTSDDDDSLEYMPRNEVTHSEICLSQLREEQDPPNPSTSTEHHLPSADRINTTHSDEILIPFNCDTPLHNSSQVNYSDVVGENCRVEFNEKTSQILIPLTRDTPVPIIHPTKLIDAAASVTAGTPSQSEAAAVSLATPPPPPQESSERPRYFAAEREERFIDFNAARETLLEYTQYRLPHERNEPARDSTAERELLSSPHEHPQESSEPQYFAAEREGPIDFTAPRESLLDYTQ